MKFSTLFLIAFFGCVALAIFARDMADVVIGLYGGIASFLALIISAFCEARAYQKTRRNKSNWDTTRK